MRRSGLFVLVFVLVLASACSSAGGPRARGASATQAEAVSYAGLQLSQLPGYQASFELNFAGQASWRYRLELRGDGQAVEYRLHLEGVSPSENPGDVRLVSRDGVSRMIGPGTGDECVQFPSDLDLGPAFLMPDDLLKPNLLSDGLQPKGAAELAGRSLSHYALRAPELDDWQDVQVDVWRDEASGATLGYDLLASGTDPLFHGGQGLLAGRFRVEALAAPAIEPIAGCEVDLPLPPGADRLVRLPGLIAFDSELGADALTAFYQAQLAALGWQPTAEPQAGNGAVVLSYALDAQTLDLNIESTASGAHVELLRDQTR